jgi:phage-related minor tail protein
MAFKLAEAFVQFGSKGFTTVEAHIAKIKRGLFELSSAGGLTTAISLTGLVAGLFKSVAAAEEADKAQRRLHATIRLMGEEAGITAQEINAIAGSLANASEFDDDAIAKATVSMLEFGNIAPSMLKRAIPVAIDLAARNGDLEGTFKALGAALDDPVNSIGLLRRQYRALSADVLKAAEELAKSGDVVGAQRMI